jgi:uncharacterized protein involved in exopolysaccharide biosynthesis
LDDINLTPAELLGRLWRRKFWALGILSVCFALGCVYLNNAEPLYEIQANLLLESDTRLLRVDRKQGGQQDKELTATQSEILSSWYILSEGVTAYQSGDAVDPVVSEELRLRLSEGLTVKPIVGTRILNVSLRWDDREQGKVLAEHLIDLYQKFLLKLDQGGQTDALKTLSQTEAKIRTELVALQVKYREVCKTSSLLGNADSGWALQQSLLQNLGAEYMAVRSKRIGLENRLATLDIELAGTDKVLPNPTSTPKPLEGQVVTANFTQVDNKGFKLNHLSRATSEQGWAALQMLNDVDMRSMQEPVVIQQELFQAEVQRQELVEKYLPNHPEVRAIEKQIADWKQRLQTLVDRAPLVLDRELKAAKLQEDRLRLLYEEELSNAKHLDQQRLEQEHLNKQIEQVETLHNSVVTQLTEMRLNNDAANEGGADLRVTILQPPTPNTTPAWPDKKLVLAGSLLMGLLGSSMLAFIPISDRANQKTTPS